MYRINDKQAAITRVQTYLAAITKDIFVAPSGVFDENTKLAVKAFQENNGIEATGIVDLTTLELLYRQYRLSEGKKVINDTTGSFIIFPMQKGDMSEEIFHINNTLIRLLDYYGKTHRLRASCFYSEETAHAVSALREIYMLEGGDFIDELLYSRMIKDHNSQSIFLGGE